MGAITPLWDAMPLSPLRAEPKTAAEGKRFGNIFETAIEAVRVTDDEKNKMQYLMATGQLDNPALLTTAMSKAELSVSLLIQLRNKAVEAYNELVRISI